MRDFERVGVPDGAASVEGVFELGRVRRLLGEALQVDISSTPVLKALGFNCLKAHKCQDIGC